MLLCPAKKSQNFGDLKGGIDSVNYMICHRSELQQHSCASCQTRPVSESERETGRARASEIFPASERKYIRAS